MIQQLSQDNFKTITDQAAQIIKNGGIVAMPFDTVYGLVCDPKNKRALEIIFHLKERPLNQTIGLATYRLSEMEKYAQINDKQSKIIRELIPGKYTFILKQSNNLLSDYCYQNGTIAIRIPNNELVLAIAEKCDGIIAQTSANKSEAENCYSVTDLQKQFSQEELDSIDFIIDGGEIEKSAPSNLLELTKDETIEIER
jgi:L-threonylcarbamoyladenylate synthase